MRQVQPSGQVERQSAQDGWMQQLDKSSPGSSQMPRDWSGLCPAVDCCFFCRQCQFQSLLQQAKTVSLVTLYSCCFRLICSPITMTPRNKYLFQYTERMFIVIVCKYLFTKRVRRVVDTSKHSSLLNNNHLCAQLQPRCLTSVLLKWNETIVKRECSSEKY